MAEKNFIIIRTEKGRKYAGKIARSIRWINENKYPQHTFVVDVLTLAEFMHAQPETWIPGDTVVHPRCANPRTDWTIKLRKWQDAGFRVVNSVDCIELTSNKLACSLQLQGKVAHPKSWEYRKDLNDDDWNQLTVDIQNSSMILPLYLIAKPLTSLEQGANVRKIDFWGNQWENIRQEFNLVPGNKIVVQEFIPYTALHRVIVIGGKALPYTFVDRMAWHAPGDWKVSCCLNKTTMQLNENAPQALLKLAEDTQKAVGGVINFIDIFEYEEKSPGGVMHRTAYTNAEINTACSLNIHERLARAAGRPDWNIHFRIANQLVKESMK